jgi:homoserine O-acetyltransferase
MGQQIFKYEKDFKLESGDKLKGFSLAYHTYGKLNKDKSNVIWICHALTANSDAESWWPGLIGKDMLFDPEKHFIVCANILGSCYGSTGPLSVNPATGKPYFHEFPFITVRDIVASLDLLRQNLGITEIDTVMGGSLGGQQALEWSIIQPDVIKHVIVVASSAVSSPWGIAFRESQRLAIAADPTWKESKPEAGQEGLKVARSIALLSYRNYITYGQTQKEDTENKVDDFKAASYQRYQGEKLVNRSFNAFSYWTLSKVMDTHNVGRGRGGVQKALGEIKAKVLAIGISSDVLFPASESKSIAQNAAQGTYEEINSLYGHDGFLIEVPKLTYVIQRFYQKIMKTPKIGLFGLGCVGQGFYELSRLQTPTAVPSKIVVRDPIKKRGADSTLLSFDQDEVLNDDTTNLVVEVIDNSKDAIEIVRKALKVGKNVVTANKKMIVENYPELLALQEKTGAGLLYEAAVCASIPILRTIDSYFSQEPISSIRGLCNGTSNYILTAVYNRGWDYSVALAEAQRLGFAESDPTLDVESFDARFKLIILTLHGFGLLANPDDVFCYGISNIHPSDIKFAKGADYKIRQVAQAYKVADGKISLWVTPQFVGPSDPLYHVDNEFNGITIDAEHSGTQFFSGRGAGSYPTGAAVLSDVHASLAGFKYRYEKYRSNNGLVLTNDTEIEVYLRSPNEKILDQIPLKNRETYGRNFATGRISLAKLLEIKPLLMQEKVFFASLPFSTDPNKNAAKELAEAQLQKEAIHLKN